MRGRMMPDLQETEEPQSSRDDLRRLGALHLQFHGRGSALVSTAV